MRSTPATMAPFRLPVSPWDRTEPYTAPPPRLEGKANTERSSPCTLSLSLASRRGALPGNRNRRALFLHHCYDAFRSDKRRAESALIHRRLQHQPIVLAPGGHEDHRHLATLPHAEKRQPVPILLGRYFGRSGLHARLPILFAREAQDYHILAGIAVCEAHVDALVLVWHHHTAGGAANAVDPNLALRQPARRLGGRGITGPHQQIGTVLNDRRFVKLKKQRNLRVELPRFQHFAG